MDILPVISTLALFGPSVVLTVGTLLLLVTAILFFTKGRGMRREQRLALAIAAVVVLLAVAAWLFLLSSTS